MSGPLILFVGAIYAFVSLDSLREGDLGMCIAFAGYAFSNYGLYLLAGAAR